MSILISNPPYNMKWEIPLFPQMQKRFSETEVPPESNANFAFVLTALELSNRSVFILPCGILTTENKQEKAIRRYLVEKNLIEAVITCPDNMFGATSIPTCIIVFDKNKKTEKIEMIDMRNKFEIEIREQNGQFGSDSHTKRVYKKEMTIFTFIHYNTSFASYLPILATIYTLLRETGIYIDEDGKLSDDENCEDVKISYCPMCGRKL